MRVDDQLGGEGDDEGVSLDQAMEAEFKAAFEGEEGGDKAADQPAATTGQAAQPGQAAQTTAGQAAQAAAEIKRHAAPERWHQDAKKAWEALYGYEGAHTHMESINAQWQRANAYITQQEQQRAALERQWSPVAELIQPYAQQWAQQGMTPDAGLRQVLSYAQALAEDPASTLMQLAEMYGVDLQKQFEDRPYIDPQTESLQRQVQQLESRLAQQDEHAQRAQRMQLSQAVREFATATDEAGNLKHPYFEDDGVFDDMLKCVSMGYADTPEKAYSVVIGMRPDIQERMAAERKQAADAAAIQAAKQKSAQVTRTQQASGTIKGSGKGAPARMSEREAFEDAHAQLSRK